jgi:uncharacterized protein
MPLLRLLFLLLLAFIAWRAYRLFFAAKSPSAAPPPLQDMVRCAVCDVHVPARTAVHEGGKSFCSEAHRSQNVSGSGKV